MRIEPRNKWITIKPAADATMVGRLFVPGNHSESYKFAHVIAVGPDVDVVSAGDFVVYDSLGVVEIRVESGMISFVKAANVMGVITVP